MECEEVASILGKEGVAGGFGEAGVGVFEGTVAVGPEAACATGKNRAGGVPGVAARFVPRFAPVCKSPSQNGEISGKPFERTSFAGAALFFCFSVGCPASHPRKPLLPQARHRPDTVSTKPEIALHAQRNGTCASRS